MSEALVLVLAGMAGGLLGGVFFGGLWWTVRRGLSSQRPAAWFVGSLLVRMGITLAGFYLVGREDWKRLVACLVGFVMARLVVTWLTHSRGRRRPELRQEARHAPQS
jgi:F1F0 ATPase subunit 2